MKFYSMILASLAGVRAKYEDMSRNYGFLFRQGERDFDHLFGLYKPYWIQIYSLWIVRDNSPGVHPKMIVSSCKAKEPLILIQYITGRSNSIRAQNWQLSD